ncbi:bifunctional folylpolyglutamate synthase/dihydrofolate synthase [Pantanalinema sp. GBBB05]|uniref:bifunctional folylpolyglutamate synthase/dihydrofolate synthase n=1 Tax=Pantanalinema sp. GBBB05 TaxID=2604139 RepID=UPI001D8C9237|nr:bifunctional folylpolyglutamate synthase/dihydrofolate synthase [Pantanalinema sp. GBBB05]
MTIAALLQQFELFGVKLGLDSSQRLLANLGNPHQQVPIIHVAGSNGKGSVCAYLSAVLTAAGYRVGRYTSPHLVDWNERICLNEQPISSLELEQYLHQVIAAIQPTDPTPTQFEVITAAAWLYFAQQQVDIAVMEVGLGGRLDATNVCDRPLVSVITSISREHWQRLGSTLGQIAGEKAGILKPGCPAVIGQLPPEAATVVTQRIADLGCPTVWVEPAIEVERQETRWADYQGVQYPLPLHGAIQLSNSAMAIAALKILQDQGWHIPETAIATGMANTKWAGRLQWFTWQGQRILIDGAHNPASAEVLRQYVDQLVSNAQGDRGDGEQLTPLPSSPPPMPLKIQWVIGMLSTKDHADIFKALLRPGEELYLVPVPDHSSADPETLAGLARQICPELAHCQVCIDVFSGLDATFQCRSQAPGTDHLTVLCGSLYLIGDFFKQVMASA